MLRKAQAIRRDGSAALNLAYIACGRFDGFWELGLSPWDVAAGFLLIEEAGGQIKNFAGRNAKIENHSIIAGNSFITSQLLQEIQATRI
jgi:myo-inositol-1(or 4)-monophosphatase